MAYASTPNEGLLPRWAWLGTVLGALAACSSAQPEPASPTATDRDGARRSETAEGRVGAVTGSAVTGSAPSDVTTPDPLTERARASLVGVRWRWERFVDPIVGGIDVPEPSQYTLSFDEDGVAHVISDCNHGSGPYMLDANELTVRILHTTGEDCGAASLSDEFVDNVNSVSRFRLVDGRLVLDLRWDTGTMEFSPAP